MDEDSDILDDLIDATERMSSQLEADIYLYAAPMLDSHSGTFLRECGSRTRNRNVVLILATNGGSADAAYRIARCLRRNYEKITVFIDGYCKSAGTLLAMVADELVMTDFGELGPLDVQISKPDELGDVISGLIPMQALNTLQVQAFESFETHFMSILMRSGFQITTKTASEIAANITVGLFSPIYQQIDPMRLGEMDRSVRIAMEYGERIAAKSKNLKPDALAKLVAAYPSHEFVIDRDEARDLFRSVRSPEPEEIAFLDMTHELMHMINGSMPFVVLNDLRLLAEDPDAQDQETENDEHGQSHGDSADEQSAHRTGDRADGAQAARRGSEKRGNGTIEHAESSD